MKAYYSEKQREALGFYFIYTVNGKRVAVTEIRENDADSLGKWNDYVYLGEMEWPQNPVKIITNHIVAERYAKWNSF